MMIGIVVVAVIIIVIGLALAKSKSSPMNDKTANIQPVDISDQIIKKSTKARSEKEEKAVEPAEKKEDESGKKVYYWLNAAVKQMFYYYRNEKWNELTELDVLESGSNISLDTVKASLGEREKALFDRILQCVSMEDGSVKDQEALKAVFFDMVMPFYPVYYYIFGNDIRYTAFLNKNVLNMFHQLSGKKFRLGYRNRYASGVTAFAWEGDQYKVFRKDGSMVCDAVFKDHVLYHGFGTTRLAELSDGEWEVEKTGTWNQGSFVDGTVHYLYQRPCK